MLATHATEFLANEMERECASMDNVPQASERGDDDGNNGGVILTKR